MKSVICAIVKDERPFIKEWVEWNLNKGFDALYIYEDYGSDSHYAELEDYIQSGVVFLTRLDDDKLPIPKAGCQSDISTQKGLYDWFLNQCKNKFIDADWVGFFDVDEFIDFEDGWDLNKLEQEYANFGGVLLSWVIYGANGHLTHQNSVIEGYPNHLPLGTIMDNSLQWNVKSLVNIKNCDGMKHIHAFNNCVKTNGNPDIFSDLVFDKAWLRHYYSKSWEDYLIRIFSRGNMQNNNRCLDKFFATSPEFASQRLLMIEELRYRHAISTMWISKKEYIISGGNRQRLDELNKKINKQ